MKTAEAFRTLILVFSLLGLVEARTTGTYIALDYPAPVASNELQIAVTYLAS